MKEMQSKAENWEERKRDLIRDQTLMAQRLIFRPIRGSQIKLWASWVVDERHIDNLMERWGTGSERVTKESKMEREKARGKLEERKKERGRSGAR